MEMFTYQNPRCTAEGKKWLVYYSTAMFDWSYLFGVCVLINDIHTSMKIAIKISSFDKISSKFSLRDRYDWKGISLLYNDFISN